MASEKKYSFELIARSGDRVLAAISYPEQSYVELVTIQAIISNALVKAGFEQAVLKGDEVPPQIAALFGVSQAPAKNSTVR